MKKTICLNMIVKNECSAIKNCLDSVKGWIDTWVIVDTGSTDQTREVIQNVLRDLPGALHERPWVNFSHNRNEALQLAFEKADYILFLDADEEMIALEDFDKSKLEKDAYYIRTKGREADHFRLLLIRSNPLWVWEGSLHENLARPDAISGEILPTLINQCKREDGGRSQNANKYLEDAKELEKAPPTARNVYYLAQSYANTKEFSTALKHYQRRVSMQGEPDETFWSLYCIGHMQELLKLPIDETIRSFCKAYYFDPARAEPLERISAECYRRKWSLLGYLLARYAMKIPMPTVLYSNMLSWVYDYYLLFLAAECAFDLKKTAFALDAYQQLLKKSDLPQHLKSHVKTMILKIS
jgi:glycosyltransferase involved in cell wall biosynthesis